MENLIAEYWALDAKLKDVLIKRIKDEGDKTFNPPIMVMFDDPLADWQRFEDVCSLKYDSKNNDIIVKTSTGDEFSYKEEGTAEGTLLINDWLNGTKLYDK